MALQQDFKEWHAATFMITSSSMRSFNVVGAFFGVGGYLAVLHTVVTNSSA